MRNFGSLNAEVCIDIHCHFDLGVAVAVLVSTYNYTKNAPLRTEVKRTSRTVTRRRVLGFCVFLMLLLFASPAAGARIALAFPFSHGLSFSSQ